MIKYLIGSAICLSIFLAWTAGAANGPDYFTVYLDPDSKKQLGEKNYNEILDFFKKAEAAIESRDLDGVMELYSDNYVNGFHDKKSAKRTWKRIFRTFDGMATKHMMRLVTHSSGNVAVISCSGFLMGIPEGKKYLITIDHWANQDHIIAKEGGKWKLIGTSGKEEKRLWFDKPLHPFF
ncbi:MAG: hypothetical protein V3S16_00625 [Candidatus Desulfatibia sp.]|uniref:hypothetical protein n=1 Tax=Candidatus Desulfatibia sp. TaxID=3101189 RepID=UPI002F34961A